MVTALDHPAKEAQASAKLFDNVLTYEDLQTALKIPRRTLERMVSRGEIPHRKVRRFVRFYWPDIVAWLQNQKGAKTR